MRKQQKSCHDTVHDQTWQRVFLIFSVHKHFIFQVDVPVTGLESESTENLSFIGLRMILLKVTL